MLEEMFAVSEITVPEGGVFATLRRSVNEAVPPGARLAIVAETVPVPFGEEGVLQLQPLAQISDWNVAYTGEMDGIVSV